MTKNKFDVIVIGGGAAGFFAAINLAERLPHISIAILEKSAKLLQKVSISGGGRCNVTHACFDPKTLIQFYPRGNKELLSAFHQFNPNHTVEWFLNKNIPLKTEEDGRMFPKSNTSSTIVNCFLEQVKRHNIAIITSTKVTNIQPKEKEFELQTSSEKFVAKKVIITAGGFNKEEHFDFIKTLGHNIKTPVPSLFTFNLQHEKKLLQLQGISTFAEVKLKENKLSENGQLLITHWGISGPAVLKLSAKAALFLYEKNYQFQFFINWLPHEKELSLNEKINLEKSNHPSKKTINSFPFPLASNLKTYLLERSNISLETKWSEFSKKQQNKLIQTLLADEYTSSGKTTFKQEFVTCGGVDLKQINFKTMESKVVSGLYFAGEVLNIDALTGGFNFQAAWTTAWIAANNIEL